MLVKPKENIVQSKSTTKPFVASSPIIQKKLEIGESDDKYEAEADRMANQVVQMKPIAIDKPKPTNTSIQRKCTNCEDEEHIQKKALVEQVTPLIQKKGKSIGGETVASQTVTNDINQSRGRGKSLNGDIKQHMESGFGTDFSNVRIHTDSNAINLSKQLNAQAFTVGNDIYFNEGKYKPNSNSGKHLLAHELTHTLQQGKEFNIRMSPEDWLQGTPNIRQWSFTEIQSEIDELEEWQSRQIESSSQTIRIDASLVELHSELQRRESRASRNPRQRRRARRRSRRRQSDITEIETTNSSLVSEAPRILTEIRSVQYSNPEEIRHEYNLIMEWLSRDDISNSDIELLNTERDNLRSSLNEVRTEDRVERYRSRLTTALTSGETDDSQQVIELARTIESIVVDTTNPNIQYIYHNNERITISTEQSNSLHNGIVNQFQRFHSLINGRHDYYFGRYRDQLDVNIDHPITSTISGWLSDVDDPFTEVMHLFSVLGDQLIEFERLVRSGSLVQAASRMASMERNSQRMRGIVMAWIDGQIEGASRAVGALEFTRDASFAIAGSIAAVVAAPVVATAVASTGATGLTAGVGTTLGTGFVVGSGTAVVRGTSAAGGELLAGNGWAEAFEVFKREYLRGYRDGLMAGAAGGAGHVFAAALGVGAQVSQQVLRRVAAESITNAVTSLVENLINGSSPREAIQRSLVSAVVSIPGSRLGASNNVWARELGGPLAEGAAAYATALSQGASPEETFRAVSMAVTSNVVMNRASVSNNPSRVEGDGNSITQNNPRRLRGASAEGVGDDFTLEIFHPVRDPEIVRVRGRNNQPLETPTTQGRLRGASAEGMGDDFILETFQPTRDPEVTRVRGRNSREIEPLDVPDTRRVSDNLESGSTPQDYNDVIDEFTGGTSSRNLHDAEELNDVNSLSYGDENSLHSFNTLEPHPESLRIVQEAGVPAEVVDSGYVMTREDFPDYVNDNGIPRGRIPPDRRSTTGRTVSRSQSQNIDVLTDIQLTQRALEGSGARIVDVRIDQTQVSTTGERTGTNRPDLQFSVISAELNGRRIYIEYDRSPPDRAIYHAQRIIANDPDAIVILKVVDYE